MAVADTPQDQHAEVPSEADHVVDPHGHADHGTAGGHDVGHAQEALGPIDWRAWGAAVLGAAAAGAIAVSLYLASHPGS